MLRGDLQTTPLTDLLQRLADAAATGCIYLLPDGQPFDSEEAAITLRDGAICGVTLPSTGDALGIRLVATNQLTPAELAEAQLAQETELASWMLADLLIHLGLADEQTVQSLTAEQALSDLTHICTWTHGSWRFRRRARLGRNLPSPLPVDEALATVRMRQEQWRRLLPTLLGADAMVSLAADGAEATETTETTEDTVEMDSDAFTLLCAVDGTRTVADLAIASGFTLLDAGRMTAQLVAAGLVQVTRDMSQPPLPGDALEEEQAPEQPGAQTSPDEYSGAPNDVDYVDFVGRADYADTFDANGPLLPENIRYGFAPTGSDWEPPSWQQSDRLADALARVSAALADAMTAPSGATEPSPEEPPNHIDTAEEVEAAEGEAFLETIKEPYDDDFLDAVEAVTTPGMGETELPAEVMVEVAVEDAITGDPEDTEDLEDPETTEDTETTAEESVSQEPVAKSSAPQSSGRTSNAAEASRMLSQLAGESFSDAAGADDADDDSLGDESESADQHAAPVGYTPTPRRQTGPADTAALLRELSSLGAESADGASRSSSPRPAAAAAAVQQRKRKGLFGRS